MLLRIFTFLVSFVLFSYGSDYSDSKTSGATAGATIKSKYGSKSGVNTNISAPMQSSGTLTTVDGSSSFSTNVNACASNNDGFKITFTNGTDGQINMNYYHDTDANGSYNYSKYYSGITHICGGGVKSSNGRYSQWVLNSTTKIISLESLSSNVGLGSCYCILNSCNYGGYSQNIADNVVGDIISAVGSSSVNNYQLGINRYDSSSKTYYLSVKDNTTCQDGNLGNDYTNVNPKTYYYSQSSNTIDVADVVAKDSTDTSSIYFNTKSINETTITSSNGTNNLGYSDYKSCTVKRVPYEDSNGNIKIEVVNSCSEYESNSSCSVNRERICDVDGNNCIDSILNNSNTSYSIPTHCVGFSDEYNVCDSGSKIYSVKISSGSSNDIYYSTKAYLFTSRTYDCGTGNATFDSASTDEVIKNTNVSGSTINYKNFNGTSSTINLDSYDSCQTRYCSYKKTANSTVEFSDGTTNSNTTDGTSTNELGYKECTSLATGNYSCPLSSGESLVEACSCSVGLNGTGTALGYISAIEDAVNDFTCSSN